MSRTAEHTIKGFIYQFLVTLSKVLTEPDSEVTVEGVIEDVEVATPSGIIVYQCKYHETKAKFNLSSIYKPVLQMLVHFSQNQSSAIHYRLHAHFPNETVDSKRKLTGDEIDEVLSTMAGSLKAYKEQLAGFTKKNEFLDRFEIHFGPSYTDLESSLFVALSKEGLSTEDVKEIFYPNAVHKIAELSIASNVNERKVKGSDFLQELQQVKKVAVSRWTKELESYQSLLKRRKRQLREDLNKNHRRRCIVIDANYIDDYEMELPVFIKGYLDVYNSKIKLSSCPTFSLIGSEKVLNLVWQGLMKKNVTVERGLQAGAFNVDFFLREPVKNYKDAVAAFDVRICSYESDFEATLLKASFDDIYVISKAIPTDLNRKGEYRIEHLGTDQLNELKYLLSITNQL